MGTLLGFLSENWKTVGVILAVFIDISPIKINPVKWVLKMIGNLLFADRRKRLDELEKSIDNNEMDRIRSTVLDFATSCRRGVQHTKDEYQHIINLKEKYDVLLEKRHQHNGVFDVEYAYILEVYHNNAV